MTKVIKIDFVSDVVCPWCVIGLGSLAAALNNLSDQVHADIHFQPFELNPDMPPGGQNLAEHLTQKYGPRPPEQSAALFGQIQTRAAEVGFRMNRDSDTRIYNTFNAHRLLHWAGIEGSQLALQRTLFAAYFTDGRTLDEPDVLIAAAVMAGLAADAAREVLSGGRYAAEVRAAERRWQAAGVQSVPAIIINDKYLISGAQPVAVFEQALREIARAS